MSLSAERVAIANQAIAKTFEQASVAWQAIPHWDTGDRGQTKVRGDIAYAFANDPDNTGEPPEGPLASAPADITGQYVSFRITWAQATAEAPDALLTAVMARTASLARAFDKDVLTAVAKPATDANGAWFPELDPDSAVNELVGAIIKGRERLEDAGFRAASCLLATTDYYANLNLRNNGVLGADALLDIGYVNSLHRISQPADRMILFGRRQDIEHGCAASATAGEEPVDLAVSVPPSLEVIGENEQGEIELGVRIRYATRVKDQRGVVVFHDPDPE